MKVGTASPVRSGGNGADGAHRHVCSHLSQCSKSNSLRNFMKLRLGHIAVRNTAFGSIGGADRVGTYSKW